MTAPSPSDQALPKPAFGRLYGALVTCLGLSVALTAVLFVSRKEAVATEAQARAQEQALGQRVLCGVVEKGETLRTVTLPGDIHPIRTATLYAKLPGYLADILVERGDEVKAGQILGTIRSPETDQQLLSAEADWLVKKQTERRYKSLIERGVVSQQELDVAIAQQGAARAEVARLKALKSYETIRAPYAGTITTRYVDAGALLPAATGTTQAAQPLVDIQDASSVRIFVYVAQSDAPFVKPGDAAHIASHELKDFFLDAKVTRVAHALDTRTRTMLVELDIPNVDRKLTPGLFVKVSLQLTTPSTPKVLSEAIFLRKGVPYAASIEDNVAHYRRVRLGQSDGKYVQVLEGLAPGQSVGLHIGDDVLDGSRVRPVVPRHPTALGDHS